MWTECFKNCKCAKYSSHNREYFMPQNHNMNSLLYLEFKLRILHPFSQSNCVIWSFRQSWGAIICAFSFLLGIFIKFSLIGFKILLLNILLSGKCVLWYHNILWKDYQDSMFVDVHVHANSSSCSVLLDSYISIFMCSFPWYAQCENKNKCLLIIQIFYLIVHVVVNIQVWEKSVWEPQY